MDEVEKQYATPVQGIGKAQSPVNIVTSDATPDQNEDISVRFSASFSKAENLGHTVELECGKGSTGVIEGKDCMVRQLHFHTPSEHLIDGITFPMEMHIVSTLQDSNAEKSPNYVVISILFKMGKENHFINEFEQFIPVDEGEHHLDSGTVNIQDLLTEIAADHPLSCFTYKGSLTTAPYSETVDWIVVNHPIEASQAQIMAIERMEGNNARHVQALYDRRIAMH
jgi:carbonic anhydrase